MIISIAKDFFLTEGKNYTPNLSQNCPRGQFSCRRVGRKKFLCLQAPSMQEWLQWDCTIDSPFSLHPCRGESQVMVHVSALRQERVREGKERVVCHSAWNNHEIHAHPPALCSLLSSALWGLPGYLISRGKLLYSHTYFVEFFMTASEKSQIHYLAWRDFKIPYSESKSVCFPFFHWQVNLKQNNFLLEKNPKPSFLWITNKHL